MGNQRQVITNYRNQMGKRFNNFGGNGTLPANSPMRTGMVSPSWNGASGNPQANGQAPQYIIQISNASAGAVMNFDVFGASIYLAGNTGGGTWTANGSLVVNNVTISSVLPNVSYQQILTSSAYKPLTVGGVYLQSVAGSTTQVTDVYQLTSQTAGGDLYQSSIAPILDGYQFQAGITYNNTSFVLETLTKLTWSQIYPLAVFQIRIFPAAIIDNAATLTGGQSNASFNKPVVIGNLRSR